MNMITDWFRRHFSDPQVVILAAFLVVGSAVILLLGDMLAPVLASLVLAYMLEALVKKLQARGVPRFPAVLIVFVVFMLLLFAVIFGLLPLLSQQISQLVQELPNIIGKGQALLLQLPDRYPNFVSREQILELMGGIRGEVAEWGQYALSLSLSSVVSLITLVVYAVLLPLLVFFFLKDKEKIFAWLRGYYPESMELTSRVWGEVDRQIGNYVRGKFLEIAIVGVVTYVTFALLGMPYAMLLGVLVGLSVIVPYVGAAVVTLPVAVIAYFHWGWGSEFLWVMVAYGVIQALDGNVLVPVLFSEVVDLHPIAIIVAILVFGGLWGFWGVFFAIPLATLVQAVLRAWPRRPRQRTIAPEQGRIESAAFGEERRKESS